jgi:hypothetical protein
MKIASTRPRRTPQMHPPDAPTQASCHCGAVRIQVARPPERLTECNCSICGRLGVLWAYYTTAEVQILQGHDATAPYIWGDRRIAFHHCRTCGCTTHYTGNVHSDGGRVAINARLLPLTPEAPVPVRRLDGATTWQTVPHDGTWPWNPKPA